jgi:hypothetical protein
MGRLSSRPFVCRVTAVTAFRGACLKTKVSADFLPQGAQPADSDEAGHAFQWEAGHRFRFEAGRDSDLMSATRRLLPRIYPMMFCPELLVKRGLDLDLRNRSGDGG